MEKNTKDTIKYTFQLISKFNDTEYTSTTNLKYFEINSINNCTKKNKIMCSKDLNIFTIK